MVQLTSESGDMNAGHSFKTLQILNLFVLQFFLLYNEGITRGYLRTFLALKIILWLVLGSFLLHKVSCFLHLYHYAKVFKVGEVIKNYLNACLLYEWWCCVALLVKTCVLSLFGLIRICFELALLFIPQPANHMWVIRFRVKLIKIKNVVSQLYFQHFRCSIATCDQWLRSQTVQTQNISILTESSVGQCWFKVQFMTVK